MNRFVLWAFAGAALGLLLIEAVLLLPPAPTPPPEPVGLRESVRTLEERAERLEEAYDRLEAEFRRYIQRAPGPTPGLAAETILEELDRLREEVDAVHRVIVHTPDQVLVIPSMKLEIERLGTRMEDLLRDRERWAAVLWERTRWLLYLMVGKGLLILGILAGLHRLSKPDAAPEA